VVKRLKGIVTFTIIPDKYEADREGFEIDIYGSKVFVPVPREKAVKVKGKEVFIKGELRYVDEETVELVDAFLVDPTSKERFPFGRHTEAVATDP